MSKLKKIKSLIHLIKNSYENPRGILCLRDYTPQI